MHKGKLCERVFINLEKKFKPVFRRVTLFISNLKYCSVFEGKKGAAVPGKWLSEFD